MIILGSLLVLSSLGLCACAKSTSTPETVAMAAEPASKTEPTKIVTEEGPDYQKAALINVELGLGYLAQGQVTRAKTKLTHALKLAPNLPETHTAMAYFMEMVSDHKDAEREHKKAVSLSSGKGAVYNNYGAFLCRRGRYKEADESFHYALEDKTYARTAEVYENAGLCALKWTDQQTAQLKAAEYLTTAIHRDPSRSSAVLELAALNLKQGKASEAKDLLSRYKSVAEPNARSLWLGIQVAKVLKDEEGVSNQALTLKNLFQDSPEYQLYLKSEKNKT
jgi:type IV pilus assembly protein PilF